MIGHKLLVRILGGLLLFLANARTLGAIEDVMFRGLEMALAHQLLLNHVLDVLDVDERLIAAANALGDRLGDVHGGLGILLDGQEGLSDRDFNLRLRRISRTGSA
jgi:hypothetical protein